MARIQLIPQPQPDGTVVVQAVVLRPAERLRRLIRRIAARRRRAARP